MNAAAGAEAFPWDEVMAAGLGLLRLAPRDFWSMTTREFAAAMRACGLAGGAPMARGELEHLMNAFPDRSGGED
ncbi:MAG: phage tail assembly chaperone [Rhizobiaceae bacterium]